MKIKMFAIVGLCMMFAPQASAQYLQPDPVVIEDDKLQPLQAPPQKQVQVPFQKNVQAPIQKQFSPVQKRERENFILPFRDRRVERRVDRQRTRLGEL